MDLFNTKALIENIFNKKLIKELAKEIKELKEEIRSKELKYEQERNELCISVQDNYKQMYDEKINRNRIHLESVYLNKEITYKATIRQYSESISEHTDAYIKLSDKHDKLKERFYKLHKKEVKRMSDRDGKGPRERSPRPSKKKGGRKLGNC